jgi:hypothetical protein
MYKNTIPSRGETSQAKMDLVSNLPDLSPIRRSMSLLSKDDRDKVKEDVMKTVAALNEHQDYEDILQESKSIKKTNSTHKHNPEVAENSFEAVLSFNDDMKMLAMNAY